MTSAPARNPATVNRAAAALFIVAAAVIFLPLLAALTSAGSGAGSAAGFRPLLRSASVALTAAVVSLALGVPFAVIVDRARPSLRKVCWGLAIVGLIVPPYIAAESMIVLFGPAGLVSRSALLAVGAGPPASDALAVARFTAPGFVYSALAAGAVLGGCWFPVVALAVSAANRRIDRRIFESARLMRGMSGVRCVALRLLAPPALGGALLVFALALTEGIAPQLLRVQTVGESVYERIQEGDLAAAARQGLLLLPVVLLAGAAGAFILARSRYASLASLEGEIPKFTPGPHRLRRDAASIIVTALAIVPALVVPAVGLTWLTLRAKLPPAVAGGGGHRVLRASGIVDSLRGAWELARDDAIRTMLLATLSATLALAFSIVLIRTAGRGRATRWTSVLGALGGGLAVPAPIVGLGLIVLWNRPATATVYGSVAVVVLAWLARFLPVVLLLTHVALTRVQPELEDAAALGGRGVFGRFATAVVPAAAPGLLATWLAVYVLSATEVAATLLVAPPGAALLAPSVVNLMRRGQDPEIAACQVLLLAVVVAPLFVIAAGRMVLSLTTRRSVTS